jgi:hypothetical protein
LMSYASRKIIVLQLAKRCVLFALEHYSVVAAAFVGSGYYELMGRMVPHLRSSLVEDTTAAVAGPGSGAVANLDDSAPAAVVAGGRGSVVRNAPA